MKKQLNELIDDLKEKSYIDKNDLGKFIKRIEEANGFTKDENKESHFCSFFLPVSLKSKQVFLGHHEKADDWIPPGGHIEKNETPFNAVHREFREELKFELTNEKVKLFDLSVIDIINPKSSCRVHWDFWYLVYMDKKTDFSFDKREFYDAGWLTVPQALEKMKKFEIYREIVKKVQTSHQL